jgi:uncharacterized protein (DUF3084 family)
MKQKPTMKTMSLKACAVLMIVVMGYLEGYGQTRIRFARGRASATVRGKLTAKGSRQYVLGAQAGQTIHAIISSTNGKASITMANGRGTDDYEVVADDGDNYIGIYNPGGATNFILTVSIR